MDRIKDPEKRAPMGRIDRIHLSRYESALPIPNPARAYAKLDILGTIDQSCCTLQNSGSDGLRVSFVRAAEQGTYGKGQMPGSEEDGVREV